MYGTELCPDCVEAIEALKNTEHEVDYRSFSLCTENIKEFLRIRDVEPMFDEIKEAGNIGIPLFVLEDGTKTFDISSLLNQ